MLGQTLKQYIRLRNPLDVTPDSVGLILKVLIGIRRFYEQKNKKQLH